MHTYFKHFCKSSYILTSRYLLWPWDYLSVPFYFLHFLLGIAVLQRFSQIFMGKRRKVYWIIWLQNEDHISILLCLVAFCSEFKCMQRYVASSIGKLVTAVMPVPSVCMVLCISTAVSRCYFLLFVYPEDSEVCFCKKKDYGCWSICMILRGEEIL